MEEKKLALTSAIDTLEKQICNLQQELLAKQRELWWLTRPHIKSFSNDWYYQSDDEGGHYYEWYPFDPELNTEWLESDDNHYLIANALERIKSYRCVDEDDATSWLICGLGEKTVFEFDEDPYPGFENAPDVVVNPNCT
ncbi:MAG: hypothetical protein IM613_12420 [Cytophagales bacterium]|jgi:hypothetical protein|nr:hypothetical protein [Cytophagales bacterium]